jgi:uncharacterized surface anchored protein
MKFTKVAILWIWVLPLFFTTAFNFTHWEKTPTPTATSTQTATPTYTLTSTPTYTVTVTPTSTVTATLTSTATITPTGTALPSETPTITVTPSPTGTEYVATNTPRHPKDEMLPQTGYFEDSLLFGGLALLCIGTIMLVRMIRKVI